MNENFSKWLHTQLYGEFEYWMLISAAAVVVIAVLIFLIVRTCRKIKKENISSSVDEHLTTLAPIPEHVDFCSIHGIGQRSEQQDAFSVLHNSEDRWILSVLCDGMGGMACGLEISNRIVSDIVSSFNTNAIPDPANWADTLQQISSKVRTEYAAKGGSTLVMTFIKDHKLWFWCIGDSDLILVRNGALYTMNRKHEYINDLFISALNDGCTVSEALENPQAQALSGFMGGTGFTCDYTIKPFSLKTGDMLLSCSDGISDTLNISTIKNCLLLSPSGACAAMEQKVLEQAKTNQDNYTAVIQKVID